MLTADRGNPRPGRDGFTAVAARGLPLMIALGLLSTAGPSGAAASALRQDAERPPDPKCGLPYRLAEAGLALKHELPEAMAVPSRPGGLTAERVIGAFRFHYDTAGADAPAMLDETGNRIPGSHEEYIDSAGAILASIHAAFTGLLGYPDPIQPSQPAYDVYVFNSIYYGETVPVERIGTSTPARYITRMNLENDFRFFYSEGLDGLRVTAAHEFFHAVQFASYGYWSSDIAFMEMTATWMEDVLYDGVNDYYQYLRGPSGAGGYEPRGHFARPDLSLMSTDGLVEYSRAIFPLFLQERYSTDLIRQAWEHIPEGVAVQALDAALAERGASLRDAFLLWTLWNAETGPDADTAARYSEGREYPTVRGLNPFSDPVIDYMPPARSIADTIQTASSAYYMIGIAIDADTVVIYDTMTVIVANTRAQGNPAAAPFLYELSGQGGVGAKQLANGLWARLAVPDAGNWSTMEFVSPESLLTVIPEITAGPNPFPGGPGSIRFFIPSAARPSEVFLTVLGVGMEQVFRGLLQVRADYPSPSIQVAEWNARDAFDRPLPSGVYVYVLTVDGREHTGKISVVR